MPGKKLSPKQMKIARVASPRDKITGADFKKLRNSTTAKKVMKKKRNSLERKLDEYNHTMELIRTILPVAILVIQVIILLKVL